MSLRILLALAALTLAAPSGASEWIVKENVDPMTDLRTASASVRSDDGSNLLVVKCDGAGEPVVSVQIITNEYLGHDVDRPLILRFNQEPALTLNWEYVGKGAFHRGEGIVRSLAHLIARGGLLKFRAFDYRDRGIDGAFSLPTGDAILRRVFHTCDYTFNEVLK